MVYIKCPGSCDGLNYIDCTKEALCEVCREKKSALNGTKEMNGTIAHFVFKKGVAPECKMDMRELRVYKGEIYILVYDKENCCVGVVFSHDEKNAPVHGQAEIAFFERYRKKYGQWHRIFVGTNGKERLKFTELEKILEKECEYHYSASLNFVKK